MEALRIADPQTTAAFAAVEADNQSPMAANAQEARNNGSTPP